MSFGSFVPGIPSTSKPMFFPKSCGNPFWCIQEKVVGKVSLRVLDPEPLPDVGDRPIIVGRVEENLCNGRKPTSRDNVQTVGVLLCVAKRGGGVAEYGPTSAIRISCRWVENH